MMQDYYVITLSSLQRSYHMHVTTWACPSALQHYSYWLLVVISFTLAMCEMHRCFSRGGVGPSAHSQAATAGVSRRTPGSGKYQTAVCRFG